MAHLGRSVAIIALVVIAAIGFVVLRDGPDDSVAGAGVPAARPAILATTSLVVAREQLVQISGRCPSVDGVVTGPVEIHEVGGAERVVRTDVTAASWTVEWRVPADASTSALRIWCGDGAGLDFPSDREIALRYRMDASPTTVTGQTLPPLPDT